jgi:hypothetical protein
MFHASRTGRRPGHVVDRMSGAIESRAEYDRRIAQWTAAITEGERRHLLISNLRLGTAVAAAVVGWLAFVRVAVSAGWFLVPAIGFLALLVVHALVLQRNERSARARRLYLRGLDRMNGKWAGAGPDGARFSSEHPYARDLDLFGPGSLFQLLTTARTESGEETLADWLRGPAGVEEIRARQQAVDELRPKLDFREDLAVLAAETHVGRTSALAIWADTPALGLPRAAGMVLGASAATMLTLLVLAFVNVVPIGAWFGWVFVQIGLVAIWRRKIDEVLHRIETPSLDIRLLRQLLARVEREVFSSPRLVAIHERLVRDGVMPSLRMKRLQTLVSVLDSTLNPLFVVFGMLLLVRSQMAVAIDRWHAAHGPALASWLKAVGELEALGAFATFAYEHPQDPFPTIVPGGPLLVAEQLAHPLIAEGTAVANDVRLGGDAPHVLLVSGSNMSGKSTLLRAIGTNVALALAGAPVRAAALTLSPMAIGATLRVEDSLQAGISRFYAEILRIRAIVEAASGPPPLLFLLDEILHGTNSHDRRIGAGAIVQSLVESGAIGLVTTHDLALTELVSALGGRAANVHFEDRIEAGKMVFDYQMRSGVVEHSNALALMRAVGLKV